MDVTDTDKLYEKPYKQPVYGKSYIDTDKLKRLAEAVDLDHVSSVYVGGEVVKYRDAILALIAENERLVGQYRAAMDRVEELGFAAEGLKQQPIRPGCSLENRLSAPTSVEMI